MIDPYDEESNAQNAKTHVIVLGRTTPEEVLAIPADAVGVVYDIQSDQIGQLEELLSSAFDLSVERNRARANDWSTEAPPVLIVPIIYVVGLPSALEATGVARIAKAGGSFVSLRDWPALKQELAGMTRTEHADWSLVRN